MKILLIAYSKVFGGVEQHTIQLANELSILGNTVHIILHKNIRPKAIDKNITIHYLKGSSLFPLVLNFKILLLIHKHKFDLLHSHLYTNTRLLYLSKIVKPRLCIIETMHIEINWRSGYKKIIEKIDGLLSKITVNHYIAVSKAVYLQAIHTQKYNPDKITIIHNGVYVKEMNEKKVQQRVQFGFLGRLEHHKGIDILINCLKDLPHSNLWEFWIAGVGPYEEEIKELARSNKNINYIGFVKDTDEFFDKIDLLVLPSRFEGLPLVILEAGAKGIPSLSTNVSGIPEVITHNKNGILLTDLNSSSLSDELNHIILNKSSLIPMKNQIFRKISKEFNHQLWIQNTMKVYKSLV